MVASPTLPWVPVLLIAALSAVAMVSAIFPAARPPARQSRLTVIAILGIAALATTVWQVWADGNEIAHLIKGDRSQQLAARVKSLEQQLLKLEESTLSRSLGSDTAAKLADYLRPFSSGRRVVVSSMPNDIEAYRYATEITNALKAAGWDARGPETTTIFGNISAMGINVFDAAPSTGTAKILLDAFAQFGIPYETRVPPGGVLDGGSVELFIGSKPVQPAASTTGTVQQNGSSALRDVSGN